MRIRASPEPAGRAGPDLIRRGSGEEPVDPCDDRRPGSVARLDDVEMVGPELDELGVVPRSPGGRRVAAALGRRDDVVVASVHEQLRNAQWEKLDRRRDRIALRDVVRAAAEQPLAGVAAEAVARATDEIGDTRLRHGARRPYPRWAAGEPVRRGQPQGEVPARGVADRDDAARVDAVEAAEGVECSRRVLERARPAAALLPDTAVLDVPGRVPAQREIARERSHQRPVPRPVLDGPREVEVPDLVGMFAVRDLRRDRELVTLWHLRSSPRGASPAGLGQ
jgi:hypothetical protein